MKKRSLFCGIFAVLFAMTSCSSDDDDNKGDYTFTSTNQVSVQDIQAYETLDVTTQRPTFVGFTKVKLTATEAIPTEGDDWDIAFNTWDIYLNAGANVTIGEKTLTKTSNNVAYYIADGTLENITVADFSKFEDKQKIEYTEWGTYVPTTRILSPIAGKIIVLRTNDGKYAKIQIDSYYQGKADQTDPATAAYKLGFFSFTYIYN
ncbi:MAG: HmuY family protein [Capnocytophaga sp.]|nr:HmuY family protein [Capnocytophaga sp.]